MGILSQERFEKLSLFMIGFTILLNIFMFSNMPSDMLVKINSDETMPRIIYLLLAPFMSILFYKISIERDNGFPSIISVLLQVTLFVCNILIILVNLGYL